METILIEIAEREGIMLAVLEAQLAKLQSKAFFPLRVEALDLGVAIFDRAGELSRGDTWVEAARRCWSRLNQTY